MKRHPLDVLSLLTGIVFLAIAAVYLFADVGDLTPALQVTMPLMIVGLGVAGLVAAVGAQRRNDEVVEARAGAVQSPPMAGQAPERPGEDEAIRDEPA